MNKIWERFVSVMRLNDELEGDLPEEEYFDEEEPYEEEYTETPRARLLRDRVSDEETEEEFQEAAVSGESVPRRPLLGFRRKMAAAAPLEEPVDDPDDIEEETEQPSGRSRFSKISPIRTNRKEDDRMEVCVIRPRTIEDGKSITETLRENCAVILNLEGIELAIAQRIVDYCAGSVYALDGKVRFISNSVLLMTPEGITISGDFSEILSSAFDIPFDQNY